MAVRSHQRRGNPAGEEWGEDDSGVPAQAWMQWVSTLRAQASGCMGWGELRCLRTPRQPGPLLSPFPIQSTAPKACTPFHGTLGIQGLWRNRGACPSSPHSFLADWAVFLTGREASWLVS